MGRVRRYKKYKACDPFSKSNGKSVVDLIHDEPPEIFENKVKKAKQMRQNAWDDPDLQERLLQKEALRTIRNEKQSNNNKDNKTESKRENETMKEFKQRIKQETRKTLAEEIVKMTSTAQKRKLKLKERSQKKKLKKSGSISNSNEEQIDFFSAENGHLRPSDLGGKSTFDSKDSIIFGEHSLRPPDLKSFVDKFVIKTTKKFNNITTTETNNDTTIIDVVDNEEDDINNNIEVITKNMRNKKRKANNSNIMYRDDMNGDDCDNHVTFNNSNYNNSNTIKSQSYKTTSSNSFSSISNTKNSTIASNNNHNNNNHHHHLEMDRFKQKVLDAYQILKNKRLK